MQARSDYAGRAALEIARRQTEQAAENGRAERRIDPVAGVDDQVLPYPRKYGGKQHEDDQRERNHVQRVNGLVHDHFVDNCLGGERRNQCDQLNDKGGE